MAEGNDKLRRQIKSAFLLRALSLKRDALDYAVKLLSEFEPAQQSIWIEKILAAISKQNVESPLLDQKAFEVAVTLCSNKKSETNASIFNVIDVFSAPRIKYDSNSGKIIATPAEGTPIGKQFKMSEMFRNRLSLVLQRAQRSTAFENFHLATVESLLGSVKKVYDVILLGMLSQRDAETYQIEDLTGAIPADLSEADFHSGLFTDGSIMLLEGDYCEGVLQVSGVGLAPIETAIDTRAHFGNENWFGGESSVAYRAVPRLQRANVSRPNARIIFVSDVWLDDPKVMKGIYSMLVGFADIPPVAFIFCGNFCSPGEPFDIFKKSKDGFRHLSKIISELCKEYEELRKSNFVFVPGLEDLSLSTVLPRPPLPYLLFEELKNIPNCSFASNPCRLQYADQEIVVFRQDIVEKMSRNSIHLSPNTTDVAEQLCKTIASVGHLCPLPLQVTPVYFEMDHALMLYPLPDVVVLADQFQQFIISQSGCIFANPSSFARSQLDFLVYYPFSKEMECSSVKL
uniref:DNA polymerase epsilon subunit n=1 Tax=Syphacia muris TaxID=451379 RepID=A0A0N5AF82_9BILA